MKKILVVFISILILMPEVKSSTTSASSYILMDQNTGRVLLSKDKDSQRLIASITKIMTCILALESGKSEDVVIVDDNATSAYGSGIYIEVGEEIKLKDLLYGLMLRSGNDAASMIAAYVSGSIEEFVKLMNNKAKELGMKNTIFYTPSGLPTPHGNLSSVYDMAILTRYAMQNKEYREIRLTDISDYKLIVVDYLKEDSYAINYRHEFNSYEIDISIADDKETSVVYNNAAENKNGITFINEYRYVNTNTVPSEDCYIVIGR